MVGEQLAGARKASGLSLQDVARRTRIPAARLQALEAGMYELLPAPIFSRGFVRAYAAEVGLNPEELVHQYDAERPPAVTEPTGAHPRIDVDDGTDMWSWKGAALAAVGLAAVVFLFWPGRSPSAARPDLETPSRATLPAPAASGAVATTGDAVDAHADEGVSVVLTAERVCWVAAEADGRRVMYRLMQTGETVTLDAHERIALRVGDAGGLTLSVNGGAPQTVGADGEVRALTLGR